MEELRICRTCKKEKPLSEFNGIVVGMPHNAKNAKGLTTKLDMRR